MYQFIVPQVKKPLDGEVEISGAKNAVLAVMAAALLADGVSEITNVPHLKDMKTMSDVLRVIGCHIGGEAHTLRIDTRGADHLEAPYELVKTMRASFYVLGPLVARFGRCRVSLPGGCAWGPRPVDLHLKGLEALGAKITVTHGYVEATCDGRLPGGTFHFPISSVGATVNVLMAATLAKGTSVLQNAALEPEIDNLVDYLIGMGAKIQGRGTRTLTVQGVEALRPGNGVTIPDRIEAGTYLCPLWCRHYAWPRQGHQDYSRTHRLDARCLPRHELQGISRPRLGRSRRPQCGTQADYDSDSPVPGLPHRHAGAAHGNAPLSSGQQRDSRYRL